MKQGYYSGLAIATWLVYAHRFLDACRTGKYPTAKTLADDREVHVQTARRMIHTMRDYFNAPLEFDNSENGWYLTEPWELRI